MKLWVIRHAKSSWAEAGLSDFERPLNARGRRDGPRMAAWLAKQTDPAQWIWTSPAARAAATAEFVREGFALTENAVVAQEGLYHASPEGLLDVIRQTPPEITSVAVVAHNPGLTWLVNGLGADSVTDNLPTFGVARFDCGGDWNGIHFRQCTLELLAAPKTIDD